MTRRIVILGIGCAAVDDIVYIYGTPPSDGKALVVGEARDFGGLTATALAAAAHLGASCRFAGRLGNDPESLAVTAIYGNQASSSRGRRCARMRVPYGPPSSSRLTPG